VTSPSAVTWPWHRPPPRGRPPLPKRARSSPRSPARVVRTRASPYPHATPARPPARRPATSAASRPSPEVPQAPLLRLSPLPGGDFDVTVVRSQADLTISSVCCYGPKSEAAMSRGSRDRRKVERPKGAPRRRAPGKAGLKALIGLFASRAGDLAIRHDDYLYGWKKPAE